MTEKKKKTLSNEIFKFEKYCCNKYIFPWNWLKVSSWKFNIRVRVRNSISVKTLEVRTQCVSFKKKKKRWPKLIFELQGTLSDKVYARVAYTRSAKTCNFHIHVTTFPSTRKFRSYLGVMRVYRIIFICNVYTYAYKYNNKMCSQQCLFQLRR